MNKRCTSTTTMSTAQQRRLTEHPAPNRSSLAKRYRMKLECRPEHNPHEKQQQQQHLKTHREELHQTQPTTAHSVANALHRAKREAAGQGSVSSTRRVQAPPRRRNGSSPEPPSRQAWPRYPSRPCLSPAAVSRTHGHPPRLGVGHRQHCSFSRRRSCEPSPGEEGKGAMQRVQKSHRYRCTSGDQLTILAVDGYRCLAIGG